VLVEGLGGPPIGIRHHDLREVLVHGLKDGAGLAVGALVENLAQVAKTVDARHAHAQALVLAYLLREPVGAQRQNVLGADSLGQRLNLFLSGPGHTSVRDEHVDVAALLPDEPLDLLDFIGQVGGLDDVIALAGELALNDDPALQVLAALTLPGAGECAVAPAVAGGEKRLHGLSEDLARDGHAQVLKAVPAEIVQVVHEPIRS